jgi:translation elongation factor EF-1alpha
LRRSSRKPEGSWRTLAGYLAQDLVFVPYLTGQAGQGITSQMTMRDVPEPLASGFSGSLLILVHAESVPIMIKSIDARLEQRSGKVVELNPQSLRSREAGLVTVEPLYPDFRQALVVEEYARYPPLGRFVVRCQRQTVCLGVVTFVERQEVLLGKGARRPWR